MYTNTRRAATNYLQTNQTNYASATSGADQRKTMANNLTPIEKKQLQMFKLSDGRTEIDVYPVFVCSIDYKSARVALETDTPPRLIVQDLIGLDKITKDTFFLPAIIVNKAGWRVTFPKFERWSLSSSRYPSLDEINKTAQPSTNSNPKEISELDMVEMYFSALFGTLSEFFANGDIKYAENAWKLAWTLNIILQTVSPKDDPNITQLLTQTERFKTLILNRDKSVNDAVEYRRFINGLKPAHYYWMLYQLMLECPEVVHKSHLSNLDTFILGLMTQSSLGDIGCTLPGIEDSLLRMILERSMKWIGKQNLSDFVGKDEMVEFLHKNAGRSVESSLRYWSFMVETIRSILLVRSFTRNEFVAQVRVIRDNMKLLKGITPFCLSMCPDADKYLNDDVISEFILSASQGDKKFTVLATSILSSKTSTPMMNEVLEKNIHRVQKLQEELKNTEENLPDNRAVTSWNDFLSEVKCTSNTANTIHSDGHYNNYKLWIIKLAYRGDNFSLRCLQQLLNEGYQVSPPLLGSRRATTLILRASRVGSNVFAHYSEGLQENYIKNIQSELPRGSVGTMLRDINRDLSKVVLREKESEERPGDFDSSPIEFVKFELAREMIREVKAKIKSEIATVLHECYICFEEIPSNKMVVLHGDPRHSVCESCRVPLQTCPFCRANL